MKNELLLLKKHTDTLIERTKTKPQETVEFKLNKQVDIFSFSPALYLSGEGKCLVAVTSFEATISVFKINDKNNSFSLTISGHWNSKSAGKTINELNFLLELQVSIFHQKEQAVAYNLAYTKLVI